MRLIRKKSSDLRDEFLLSREREEIQWNLDLMKCQGTGKIGLLYRGSVPYITPLLG